LKKLVRDKHTSLLRRGYLGKKGNVCVRQAYSALFNNNE
jgi:hypothetical protein